ncbi:hypothetical protein Shyhy01_13370 [Streptomyces hygroscopicus subsp. hygroscopicus]|nr:hypothetical protein Shyhy01_13370 [Streptomyces hygroscopicus subsp. hygroscopicus]
MPHSNRPERDTTERPAAKPRSRTGSGSRTYPCPPPARGLPAPSRPAARTAPRTFCRHPRPGRCTTRAEQAPRSKDRAMTQPRTPAFVEPSALAERTPASGTAAPAED